MAIKISVPLKPEGKARHRSRIVKGYNSHGNHPEPYIREYADPKQAKHLFYFRRFLKRAWKGRAVSTRPFRLGVIAFLPLPESKPKWFKELALKGEIQPTSKPDIDNIVKLVKDVANGIIWKDDSQVVGLLKTGKYYSATPKYVLIIEELPSEIDLRNAKAKLQSELPFSEIDKTETDLLTPLWNNSEPLTELDSDTIQN